MFRKYFKKFTLRLSFLLILFLSACSSHFVEKPKLNIQNPEPLELYNYNFEVYNISEEAKICLNPKGYSNLSKNFQELKRFIIQQQQIIDSYKKYYENYK